MGRCWCVICFAILAAAVPAHLYSAEFDPKSSPTLEKALDKATEAVAQNRKAYDDANQKVIEEASEALSKEVERLTKAGKLEEAIAVKKFAESMGKEVLANAEKRMSPPHPGKAGAVAWNGHKYKVFKDPCSWHDAKKRCEEMGGHLLIIDNEKEQLATVNLLVRSGVPVDLSKANWSGMCIGATNQTRDGRWSWIDGSPLAYSNWHPRNPNGGPGVHHAAMVIHFGGQWDDYNGDHPMPGFICEWDD